MERLNTLGSSLPPEQPPTNQVIESLSSELSQEFKLAANAVTKLYRVANERNSLLKHQGYLQCLEDILSIMNQNPSASVDAIHLWCLKQRNEILSYDSGIASDSASTSANNSKFDFNFDNPNVSGVNNTDVHIPKFRLSNPPPSVEHGINHKPKKTRWIKRQPTWAKDDAVEDDQRSSYRKSNPSKFEDYHHHHHDIKDKVDVKPDTNTDSGPKKKQRVDKRDPIEK